MVEYFDEQLNGKYKIETVFHLFIDSQSMLDKLKEIDEHPTAHLKTVMDSEWNVLYALHKTIKFFI